MSTPEQCSRRLGSPQQRALGTRLRPNIGLPVRRPLSPGASRNHIAYANDHHRQHYQENGGYSRIVPQDDFQEEHHQKTHCGNQREIVGLLPAFLVGRRSPRLTICKGIVQDNVVLEALREGVGFRVTRHKALIARR